MQRICLIQNQLSSTSPRTSLSEYRSKGTTSPEELNQIFWRGYSEFRKRVFQVLQSDAIFKPHTLTETDRKETRHVAWKQMKKLVESLDFNYENFKDGDATGIDATGRNLEGGAELNAILNTKTMEGGSQTGVRL